MTTQRSSALEKSNIPGLKRGDYLFKYRKLDPRCLEILKKRELFFSSPAKLNDPFDCDLESIIRGTPEEIEVLWENCLDNYIKKHQEIERVFLRHLDERADPDGDHEDRHFWEQRFDNHTGRDRLLRIIENYVAELNKDVDQITPPERKMIMAELFSDLIQLSKTQFGICSMAGDVTNILMWSHYANNHTGVAFIFDTQTRIFEKQPGFSHRPVVYSHERKVDVAQEGWPDSFIQLYTRKATEWAYEKENRYISHNGPGPKKYKRHTLKGIVLGCRFSENLKAEPEHDLAKQLFNCLVKENEERRSGSKIQLYVAHKVVGAFALKLKRLHDVEALQKYFKQ